MDAADFGVNRTIVLKGISYPLHFQLGMYPQGDLHAEIRVPYPENYPETPISQVFERELAMLTIRVEYCEYMRFSHFFSANSPAWGHLLLPEEMDALEGITHQMLCTIIYYAHTKRLIPDPFVYNPQFAFCDGTYTANEQVYKNATEEELAPLFASRPLNLYQLDSLIAPCFTKLDAMKFVMCSTVRTLETLSYYKQAYGLDLCFANFFQGIGYVYMETSFVTLLKHCENFGNILHEPTVRDAKYYCVQCKKLEIRYKDLYCSRNCEQIYQILNPVTIKKL